jgi:predicted Zn finger-like uncharacterized protein
MKIECDKCAAKYSIADEKVRGKTFKIRCKKCSNVIIVRDKAAGAAALGGEGDAGGSAGWHLAINGETLGPMSEDDVRQRFAAGEIDRETAVWQEGFEDWLPLGDVEAFADLAGGAPAAEDPFASANQDEYAAAAAQPRASAAVAAAPVAAAPVARAASGGGAAVSEPSSPRVTRLTGQRNENSVLFSLDSLQSLATGGGNNAANSRAQQQRQGPKNLATQAPSSEGSGLIDIRALGAMVGSDAGPAPAAAAPKPEDAALPSFGGANLGVLASTPLVPQVHNVEPPPMVAAAPVQPQRSNAPLYILMVLLLLAVGGLATYVVLRKPDTVVVEREVPGAAADRDEDDKDEDKDDKDEKDKGDKDDKDEKDAKETAAADAEAKAEGAEGEAAEGEAAEGGDAEGGDAKADPSKPKTPGKPTPKPSSGTPTKPSTPTSPVSKPSSTPSPKPSDNLDVDCILDPKLPKCKGGSSSSSKPSSSPKPTPAPTDPSLPETLGAAEIKAGVGPVKDAAKACGSKHGAAAGESVKIKLSIAGATGAVTSASAEPPHAGTPLGNCVAAALKKATFKKFRKASLGAVYPVKM